MKTPREIGRRETGWRARREWRPWQFRVIRSGIVEFKETNRLNIFHMNWFDVNIRDTYGR